MNGATLAGHEQEAAEAGQISCSASTRGSRIWALVAMLLTPCVASAFFTLRGSDSPPLVVTAGRPSLVFSSYMIDEGPAPVSSQPVLNPFFFFTNKGSQSVRITELIPSCGCLAPVATPMEIPPGETGRLMLPIRTRNETAGLHEYMVTVRYEDPQPREVALTYKVVLPDKLIEIEPRVLMVMGRITSKDRDVISISDHRPERQNSPMKITGVSSSLSIFSAQLAGHSTVEGVSRQTIEVTYADVIPAGQHKGLITVTTDDDVWPVLQVPVVLGDRRRPTDEPVSVSPESVRVIVDASDVEQSQAGTIAFQVPATWKVSHVEVYPEQLLGKILGTTQKTPDRTLVTVEVSLTEKPSRGIEQGTLTLYATDGDESEMVTAPVYVSWKRDPIGNH